MKLRILTLASKDLLRGKAFYESQMSHCTKYWVQLICYYVPIILFLSGCSTILHENSEIHKFDSALDIRSAILVKVPLGSNYRSARDYINNNLKIVSGFYPLDDGSYVTFGKNKKLPDLSAIFESM